MHNLFTATDWADGAMSEDLSGFFIEEMVNKPGEFLVKLTSEPKEIRFKVYRLIASETSLTANDMMRMKAYLTAIGADSEVHRTAKEMLEILRSFGGGRKLVSKDKKDKTVEA